MPSHQTEKPLYENAQIMLCNRRDSPMLSLNATDSCILCTVDLVAFPPKLMDNAHCGSPKSCTFLYALRCISKNTKVQMVCLIRVSL